MIVGILHAGKLCLTRNGKRFLMKCVLFLLVFALIAFADDDGCITSVVPAISHASGTTDGPTLSLLNDWTLAEKALGLDVFVGSESFVLGVDNINDYIQAYNPITGDPLGTLTLDPANDACFGIAWNNDPSSDTYYTNDVVGSILFFTDDFGATWTTADNPAGANGRGMDFDGTDYWITDSYPGAVWRFQPGVGQDHILVPEVSGVLSGITVYPYGSDIGVLVAGYNDSSLHFYLWDGSALNYMGAAAYPVASLASSLGLAYWENTGTLFWSYKDASNNYHLAELAFSIMALQHSTWGNIKSSF